jgi:transcriptional regulator with XRE-family HTH domain
MSLGKRIEDLRRKRGLTSRELAMGTRVTSSLISQIEHDKTSPSLETLRRIAKTLQVPLTYLLLEDDIEPQVVRKGERHIVHLENSQLRASFLSPLPPQQLELVLLDLPPGRVAWTKPRSHEGQECRLVLTGRILAHYGEKTYLLEEGDSILWNGTVPHRIENVGDGDAQLLIALTPPGYLPLEHSDKVEVNGPQPSKPKPSRRKAAGHAAGKVGRSTKRVPKAPLRRTGRPRVES